MKNKKLVLMVIFSLLIMLLTIGSISSLAAEKKVYTNGIDANFVPVDYMDEQGNPQGFDIDCINWIAKEMGFEVKTVPIAWDSIIPNLTAKKIDFIASGLSITEARGKIIDYTIPYFSNNFALAVREDSDINIVSAFSGKYTIALDRGTSSRTWIEEELIAKGIFSNDLFQECDSSLMAINNLATGRADAAIGDEFMFSLAIKGKPLKIVGIIISGEVYAYGVRKDDQELKEMLNEGLRRLMKSPKWDELRAKWLTE